MFHPTARMLVELSKAQDIEAGDGTTSVVVLCGSMLNQCQKLLSKGIHPTHITEAFQSAATKAEEVSTRGAGRRARSRSAAAPRFPLLPALQRLLARPRGP